MRISSFQLVGLGSYSQPATVDFAMPSGSNGGLTVLTGHNGAGKTTLFNAVGLCLFGRRYLGRGMARREYHSYMSALFSRHDADQATEAVARVSMEMHLAGRRSVVSVQRTWRQARRGLQETVELDVGPSLSLKNAAADAWISANLRAPLLSLCFFDAEAIGSLSSADLSVTIGQLVERVTGADVVGDLIADLEHQLAAVGRDSGDKEAEQLERITNATATLREELDDMIAEEQRLLRERGEKEAAAEELTLELAVRGVFAGSGSAVKDYAERMREARASAAEQLRRLFGSHAPFLLCPELAQQLLHQLRADEDVERSNVVSLFIDQAARKLPGLLSIDDQLLSLLRDGGEGAERLVLLLVQHMNDLVPPSETDRLVHDIGWVERDVLRSLLVRLPENRTTLSLLRARLAELDGAAEDSSREADDASGRDKKTAHLKRTHERLTEELGVLHQRFANLKESQGAVRMRIEAMSADHGRLVHALASRVGQEQSGVVALAAIDALGSFRATLVEHRLKRIEESVTAEFSRVCRKKMMLSRVSISRDDYSISLHDEAGRSIDVGLLAAGERQLFMISLIRSMREASRLNMPLLIDSPFGRLDHYHIETLREELQGADRQTVFFLTDAEYSAFLKVGGQADGVCKLSSEGPGTPTTAEVATLAPSEGLLQ